MWKFTPLVSTLFALLLIVLSSSSILRFIYQDLSCFESCYSTHFPSWKVNQNQKEKKGGKKKKKKENYSFTFFFGIKYNYQREGERSKCERLAFFCFVLYQFVVFRFEHKNVFVGKFLISSPFISVFFSMRFVVCNLFQQTIWQVINFANNNRR